MESFPALGYYFIVFRALDESYFRYTSPTPSPSSSTSAVNLNATTNTFPGSGAATAAEALAQGEEKEKDKEASKGIAGASTGRRGHVDIVEGVGGKEGVEGVGVGAINMYLLVFGDGIISVRSPLPSCFLFLLLPLVLSSLGSLP
jgi:hypothetical protein